MRVSDQMMFQNLAQNIDQAQASLLRTQEEASSGLAINQPSDNPGGTATVLQISAARSVIAGWTSAAHAAQGEMQSADQSMGELQSTLTAAISIATQASSGTNNQTEFQAAAQQVQSIIGQVDSLANTTYAGQYVFSGISQAAPVVAGAYNAGATSPARSYEIGSGVSIPVSTDGNQVFNTAPTGAATLPSGQTATLLNALSSLAADLQSGNGAAVQQDLAALQAQVGPLSSVRAVLGANMDRISAALNQLQSTDQTLQTQEGNLQNVDMAQIATQLAAQETAYQAAVAAGASMKLPTLANMLP